MPELLRPNQSAFNPPTASTPYKASPLPLPWVTFWAAPRKGMLPQELPKGMEMVQAHHLTIPTTSITPALTDQQQGQGVLHMNWGFCT